jgi:hypothetical protein
MKFFFFCNRIAQKRETAVAADVSVQLADKKYQKKDKDERYGF